MADTMVSLKNTIVFVTGASSGIGEACARVFAREGASLLLAARRKERIDRLARDLETEFHIRTYTMQLDVRDRKAVDAAISGLPAEWRAIRVLINNAGLARGFSKVHEGSVQDWEEMIDTNVKGLLYVSRAVIPGMVERKAAGDGVHVLNPKEIVKVCDNKEKNLSENLVKRICYQLEEKCKLTME